MLGAQVSSTCASARDVTGETIETSSVRTSPIEV
jgi:hypothetical protein